MSVLQWIAISLFCGILELLRAGFWFLWVAVAGLLTALGVKVGLLTGLTPQILTFTALSLVLILFIRPLVLNSIKKSAK